MPRLAAAIAALTVLLSAATTHARQYCVLTLVGGRSVEGYVLSERDGQIELEVTFGSFTRTMTILDREIIERDCETRSGGAAPTPPAEEPDAAPSPVATPDEPEDEPEADRVTYGALLVNVDGQIGGVFPDDFDTRDPTMLRADAIQEALNRFARRQADTPTGVQGMPKAIVLYVDSPGGYVAEEAAILELFDMYDERTEIVAIVKNAISAAAGITLAADRLYYLPDAAMGGMLAYTTEGVDLDDPVQQKFISIRVAKFKALAQKKDWNQDVIAAMVDPQGQDNDRVITLSGDEMEQLGERAIKVNSLEAALDDIATHYGVEIDTETFDRARRENTARVNTSATRVEKLEAPELEQEMRAGEAFHRLALGDLGRLAERGVLTAGMRPQAAAAATARGARTPTGSTPRRSASRSCWTT